MTTHMNDNNRFDTLGRLEDLPLAYRERLTQRNLVPLWPSLRGVLPPNIPTRKTQTTHWPYSDIRELLIEAGTLTPIEKAERRVLVLANPGHGLDKMQASAAMYLGMQLLLPGELAPAHRHTPNAVRMVVEGEGAWTLVGGEQCPMLRGDLILTPTGLWHEHGHDGKNPVIWLDVLDLPLIYYTETSYHLEGPAKVLPPVKASRLMPEAAWPPPRCSSARTRLIPCCATLGPMPRPHCCRWPRSNLEPTPYRSPISILRQART
jgi:gentisate 1,2-dioxygenase